MNAVDAISKLALEFSIFWSKFGVYVLIVGFLHLAQVCVVVVIVIIAVIGNIAVALLSSLTTS